MMITIRTATILVVFGTLSACGGGNDDNGNSRRGFTEQRSDGLALINTLGNTAITSSADMPVTGTATYNGTAGFAVDATSRGLTQQNLTAEDLDTLADLELNADFANSSVSGKIDNFNDFQLGKLDGSASIDNGTITGSTISADVSGSVRVEGSDEMLAGTLDGAFVGAGADGVAGTVEGDLTTSDSDFIGVFGARK